MLIDHIIYTESKFKPKRAFNRDERFSGVSALIYGYAGLSYIKTIIIKGGSWVMGNNQLTTHREEVIPTNTLAAAFAIALVMGAVVVSGIVFKPYEAKKVVQELHERILYEKEMRELRQMMSNSVVSYAPKVVSDVSDSAYYPESSYAVTPVMPTPEVRKTERAENFERDVRSDDYWAGLQDSILQGGVVSPASEPVVIPPIIVGSAD